MGNYRIAELVGIRRLLAVLAVGAAAHLMPDAVAWAQAEATAEASEPSAQELVALATEQATELNTYVSDVVATVRAGIESEEEARAARQALFDAVDLAIEQHGPDSELRIYGEELDAFVTQRIEFARSQYAATQDAYWQEALADYEQQRVSIRDSLVRLDEGVRAARQLRADLERDSAKLEDMFIRDRISDAATALSVTADGLENLNETLQRLASETSTDQALVGAGG